MTTTTPDHGDERRAYQRWEAYAKRAGFLDSNGNAYDGQQKAAQTSWFTWQACEKERDAAQPVAQEASDPINDPEIVAIRTALDWISTGKNSTGKELADRAYLALGRVRAMIAAPQPSQGVEREAYIADLIDTFEQLRQILGTPEQDADALIAAARRLASESMASAEAGKGVDLKLAEDLAKLGWQTVVCDLCGQTARGFPSESVAVSGEVSDGTGRTPKDYAIEHAEYMALAAEDLATAVNALAIAENQQNEGVDGADEAIESAKQDVDEHLSGVRNRIYEFRKRRDRAVLALAGSGGKEAAALERMARLDDEMGIEP